MLSKEYSCVGCVGCGVGFTYSGPVPRPAGCLVLPLFFLVLIIFLFGWGARPVLGALVSHWGCAVGGGSRG